MFGRVEKKKELLLIFFICFNLIGEDSTVEVDGSSRSRRDATAAFQSPAKDGNGNRILRVVRRDATDMADLETEKVIQVISEKKSPPILKLGQYIFSLRLFPRSSPPTTSSSP